MNTSPLLAIVHELEDIAERKSELARERSETIRRARTLGFDSTVIADMLRERKLSPAQRRNLHALREMYRAALGILDGTPLGDAAVKRLSRSPKDPPEDGATPDDAAPDEPPPEAPSGPTPAEIDAARTEGAAANQQGKPVLANPYAAGDPRRAAWDEGWCSATGSDGMDIPAAWRRETPKKPGKGKPDDGGSGE